MSRWRIIRLLLWVAGALVLVCIVGAAGVGLFAYSGVYDISATNQHTRPFYALIVATKTFSVRRRAAAIPVPPLASATLIDKGRDLFRENCVLCHGAPGVAPDEFARGMTPVPPPLVQTARELSPAELFWTTKFGLKMTGMPAWQFRLSDRDLWAVVAFVRVLPTISPPEYKAETGQADTNATPELEASP